MNKERLFNYKKQKPELFSWLIFFASIFIAFTIVIIGIWIYLEFVSKNFIFDFKNIFSNEMWSYSEDTFLSNIVVLYVILSILVAVVISILLTIYLLNNNSNKHEKIVIKKEPVLKDESIKTIFINVAKEETTNQIKNLNKDKTLIEISRNKVSRKHANQKMLVDLISEKLIANNNKVSKVLLASYIDSIFDEIFEVAKTEEVNLHGFGKFIMKTTPEKETRIPITGEKIIIPETKVFKFKVSSIFKNKMNENPKYKIPLKQQIKTIPLSNLKDGDAIIQYIDIVYDEQK